MQSFIVQSLQIYAFFLLMKLIVRLKTGTKLQNVWFKKTVEFSEEFLWFYSLQTEKELSKLMSRAMKEGLEGLVLKDVNVISNLICYKVIFYGYYSGSCNLTSL